MAHILVVDDEQSICELLEITSRKEGHRVEVARNGETAKRLLKSQIFDIVISDIRMPDATGVDLLQFCKEISPSSYFLLITGVPTVETAIAAINAGADRYVIKDHDLVDQLRRAVRELENTMERSVALETGSTISVNVLPEKIQHRVTHESPTHAALTNSHAHIPEGGIDLEKSVQDMERAYILAALKASDG